MNLSLKRLSPYLAKSLGLTPQNLLDQFAPATLQDFAGVVALRATLLGEAPKWNDPEYLRWRYDFSPGDPLQHNRFWVFKLNNEIVAGVGVEHYQLVINGEQKDVYQTMDILVRPELDGRGLGAWLNLALFEKLPLLIAVGTNDNSHKMVARLFHQMPDRQVWKLPLSTKGILRRTLPVKPLADLLSIPADLALRTRRSLSQVRAPAAMEMRPLERFPDAVDGLAAVNGAHGFTFTCRSAAYLNWRFCDNPRRQYSKLGFYRNSRLVGYSVFRLYHADENRQDEGVIVDWFCDLGARTEDSGRPSPALVSAELEWLLQKTIAELERKGARLVQIICYDRNTPAALHKLGFAERPSPKTFCVFSRDPQSLAALSSAERWFVSEANCDTDGF